jgi:hypothetical protein
MGLTYFFWREWDDLSNWDLPVIMRLPSLANRGISLWMGMRERRFVSSTIRGSVSSKKAFSRLSNSLLVRVNAAPNSYFS